MLQHRRTLFWYFVSMSEKLSKFVTVPTIVVVSPSRKGSDKWLKNISQNLVLATDGCSSGLRFVPQRQYKENIDRTSCLNRDPTII